MSITISNGDGGASVSSVSKVAGSAPKTTQTTASSKPTPADSYNGSSQTTKLNENQVLAQQTRANLNSKVPVLQPSNPATDGADYSKYESKPSVTDLGISSFGIQAPEVITDSSRFGVYDPQGNKTDVMSLENMNSYKTGPLDRPSVYMGTKGGKEVDAGLSWNRVFVNADMDKNGKIDTDKNGKPIGYATWTTDKNGSSQTNQYIIRQRGDDYKVYDLNGKEVAQGKDFAPAKDGSVKIGDMTLRPNFAFRAFSRIDAGGTKQDDWNFPPAGSEKDVYVYAKQKFDMSFTVKDNKFSLNINGKTILTDDIPNYGQGKIPHTFKIVDSIDQRNSDTKKTESSKTDPTQTLVSGGSWGATSLIDNKGKLTPFNSSNSIALRPDEFNQDEHNLMNSQNGKGRLINPDGSRQIYINPSRVK